MTKKTYAEKLKHPKWQKRRLEILSRDEFKCKFCSDDENQLHVHHKKYSGNPWDAKDEDLISLCSDCHEIIEGYKQTGSNVLDITKRPAINSDSFFKEVYSVRDEVYKVSLILYSKEVDIKEQVNITHESLFRHYNKINKLKNG